MRLYFLVEMNTFITKQNIFSYAYKSVHSFVWQFLMITFILTQTFLNTQQSKVADMGHLLFH